jgi:hypothetical protein
VIVGYISEKEEERDMSWIHGTAAPLSFDLVDATALRSIYSGTDEDWIISCMAMKGNT